MALSDIITTINAHIAANFNTIPIAYDNVQFDTTNIDSYVKVHIGMGKEEQVSLGAENNRYRQFGGVSLSLYGKINRGTKALSEVADELAALFRTNRINGIQFRTPSISYNGITDNSYYNIHIYIGFYYDSFI